MEAESGAGQWVEVGWGGCIWAGHLMYGSRLQIGINGPPTHRKILSENRHRLFSLTHALSAMEMNINVNLPLQPVEGWRDCSHDALLVETCTDWRKSRNPSLLSEDAMFSQVPPAGFSKSLLPTQSYNSHNSATRAHIFKAPTLMEKLYPLTHIPVI